MNKLNCAVVTIVYNPHNQNCNVVNNILTYSNFFKHIIIIDNSKNNNSYIFKNIDNAIYIPNYKNLGIAKALNIGCKYALEKNYEWILTMDQDSYWDNLQLKSFFSNIQNNITEKNISFAPTPINFQTKVCLLALIKKKILGPLYKEKKIITTNKIESTNRVITSGNIINLNVIKKINFFTEDLFIDEVDYDLCYRLKKNNYNIIYFNDIFLNHYCGDNKRTLFPKYMMHNGKRVYYIIRNMLINLHKYPQYTKDYPKLLIRYFIDSCILNRFFYINYFYFIKALIDYKKYLSGYKLSELNTLLT